MKDRWLLGLGRVVTLITVIPQTPKGAFRQTTCNQSRVKHLGSYLAKVPFRGFRGLGKVVLRVKGRRLLGW